MSAANPAIQAHFGRQLRLITVIGNCTIPVDEPEKVLRVANLDVLKPSENQEFRSDLVVLNGGNKQPDELAQKLLFETHEAGSVYLENATPDEITALKQAGFSETSVKNLLTKAPIGTPEEYGDDYLARWGDTDFLINAKQAALEIIEHFPAHLPKETARVLDVGCLNGYIMESLHRAGVKNLFGTDISYPIAITHNLNKYHLPTIRIGDFSQNTYPDGFSDVTICMEVLEHIPPDLTDVFIQELARVTSKDGILLISTSEDPTVDETHINCRKRPEWYYLFSKHELVPSGSQVIFPGFNSFVVRHAKNTNELKRTHLLNTAFFKAPKVPRKIMRTGFATADKLRKQLPEPWAGRGRTSYAQQGEDLILHHILFSALATKKHVTYMDIGAHDPFYLSNTALLYSQGFRGINIEPDPSLHQRFEKFRSGDQNLNIGLAAKPGELDFYVMAPTTLNTFDKAEAENNVKHGFRIVETKKLKVDTFENIVKKYNNGKSPDVISLDVEGLDLEILRSIDFDTYRPMVMCVETTWAGEHTYEKNQEIIDYVKTKGYMVYADTFVNTIFIDAKLWEHLY